MGSLESPSLPNRETVTMVVIERRAEDSYSVTRNKLFTRSLSTACTPGQVLAIVAGSVTDNPRALLEEVLAEMEGS
jgi:hypothetical protein